MKKSLLIIGAFLALCFVPRADAQVTASAPFTTDTLNATASIVTLPSAAVAVSASASTSGTLTCSGSYPTIQYIDTRNAQNLTLATVTLSNAASFPVTLNFTPLALGDIIFGEITTAGVGCTNDVPITVTLAYLPAAGICYSNPSACVTVTGYLGGANGLASKNYTIDMSLSQLAFLGGMAPPNPGGGGGGGGSGDCNVATLGLYDIISNDPIGTCYGDGHLLYDTGSFAEPYVVQNGSGITVGSIPGFDENYGFGSSSLIGPNNTAVGNGATASNTGSGSGGSTGGYGTQNGNASTIYVTTIQPGQLTPSVADKIITSCLATSPGGGITGVTGGMTLLNNISGPAFLNGGSAYLIGSSLSPLNPAWTESGVGNMAADIQSFRSNTTPALVANPTCTSGTGGGTATSCTTTPISTTGSTLGFACLAVDNNGQTNTITDSLGNTWNPLPVYSGSGDSNYVGNIQAFYAYPFTTGSAQTFTFGNGPSPNRFIGMVLTFSGVTGVNITGSTAFGALAQATNSSTAMGDQSNASGLASVVVSGQPSSDNGFADDFILGSNITATAPHQGSYGSPTMTDLWLGGPAGGSVTIHNCSNCGGLPSGTGLVRVDSGTGSAAELSGDATTSGSNALTLATVNSGPGTCGDSTHVCQITTNGKGLTTAQTAVSITGGGTPGGTNGQIQYNNSGAFGGISTTGSGNAVLATSPTLVTPALGTPASGNLANTTGYPEATSSTYGIVKPDNSTITISGGVISATGGGGGGTPVFKSETSTYAVLATDFTTPSTGCGTIVVPSGSFTVTLPATAPAAGTCLNVLNYGTGVVTIVPNSGNDLNGYNSSSNFGSVILSAAGYNFSSAVAPYNFSVVSETTITSDGTNFEAPIPLGQNPVQLLFALGGNPSTGHDMVSLGGTPGVPANGGTYIGWNSGNPLDGGQNTCIGFECGNNSYGMTGAENTFVGVQAASSSSGAGAQNACLGYRCLNNVGGGGSTNSYNTCIGTNCGNNWGLSSSTSVNNACIGAFCGDGNGVSASSNNTLYLGGDNGNGTQLSTVYGPAGVSDSAGPFTWTWLATGGSGSNNAGTSWDIQTGIGTGNAQPSLFQIDGDVKGASGSSAHAVANRFTLNDTKALTSGSATTVVTIPLATLQMTGGQVDYTIKATDGTNQCVISGTVNYAGENSAGTYVLAPTAAAGLGEATACTAASTLTDLWSLVSGTNSVTLKVTPTTSITTTTFLITYEIHHQGDTQPSAF